MLCIIQQEKVIQVILLKLPNKNALDAFQLLLLQLLEMSNEPNQNYYFISFLS